MFAIFPFPNNPVAMAAPLTNVIVNPTNNIVTTIATYEITFTTGTTGTIKSLQIDFPVFTDISSSKLIERSGIGRRSYGPAIRCAQACNRLVYTITNPISIPAGTDMRFEFSSILNSNSARDNSAADVATKDSAGHVIDGFTESSTFSIKGIGTNDLAFHAERSDKLAPDAVTTDSILDTTITTAKISDQAITGSKIAGLSHLVFKSCTVNNFPIIRAGGFGSGTCSVRGVQIGDRVVITGNFGDVF